MRAVRDLQRAYERATRGNLIQENLRGDTKTSVDGIVVPDEWIGAVLDRVPASTGRGRAIWGQHLTYFDVARIVVVHASADH